MNSNPDKECDERVYGARESQSTRLHQGLCLNGVFQMHSRNVSRGPSPNAGQRTYKTRIYFQWNSKQAYGNAMEPDSAHRIPASIQVSASNYSKITKYSNKQHARYVIFPGCNIGSKYPDSFIGKKVRNHWGKRVSRIKELTNCL